MQRNLPLQVCITVEKRRKQTDPGKLIISNWKKSTKMSLPQTIDLKTNMAAANLLSQIALVTMPLFGDNSSPCPRGWTKSLPISQNPTYLLFQIKI